MTTKKAYEVNFDGIVGPTHNYSGLSLGNVASMTHKEAKANPKKAALQGLEKMWALTKMGVKQAVLPPHQRPATDVLRSLGYQGNDVAILEKVMKDNLALFRAVCSASPMWTANAATIAPSPDTENGKVHLTSANLSNKFHRSIEASTTTKVLQIIFKDPTHFVVHPPLPPGEHFSDEGAANHTRLCQNYGRPGIQLFVYGRSCFDKTLTKPKTFPARQTVEACQAIARLHGLKQSQFAQQSPEAIDAGVFHNDVIAVGNLNLFLYHERAFVNTGKTIEALQEQFQKHCDSELCTIEVKENQVSLDEAVKTYLFNSQLIQKPDTNASILIAPQECYRSASVRHLIEQMIANPSHPIDDVHFFDVRESMRNGGGPACLRLRVVLTEEELSALNGRILLNEALYEDLKSWIERYYPEDFLLKDLLDEQTLNNNYHALDHLTQILDLGNLYPFQH